MKDEVFGLDHTDEFAALIRDLAPLGLMEFWAKLKVRESLRITSCQSPEALADLRSRCLLIDELSNFTKSLSKP